jgi:hypothetical protein
MATPSSLLTQLLARVKTSQETFPSITQSDIAKHCGIGEANFSAAIAGRRGLSANSVLQLHRLLSLPRNEVIAKFSQSQADGVGNRSLVNESGSSGADY